MFCADQMQSDPTFKSPQNGTTTHIDAIFTFPNFPFAPLYCHTQKSFLYLTDHLIVAAYFQPVESKKERHEQCLRTKRKVYNVSQMELSDWHVFTNYSEQYYKNHNFKRLEFLSANRYNLNIL